tara:strand:- start:356 stop:643 length:288 start_codon:yes stop_codon:yes gene_type:complete
MMNHQLTSTQAFRLGHLHHAFSLGQSLSRYAHEQGLSFADQALSLIRSLYAVEKRAQHVTAEERLSLRATQRRQIIEKLEAWLTRSLNQGDTIRV